jgi:PAT family beta-lactamase induction signal transducer AmpG
MTQKKSILRTLSDWRMLSIFLLGMPSGLPLFLIGSTLKTWMRLEKVDLTVIGFFSFVGLPYTLKFVIAPFLDRYIPPFLGRRKSWMVIFQFTLAVLLALMSMINPSTQTTLLACLAFAIALASASQDIVIDAYRREVLSLDELGLGSSLAVLGYRLGTPLISGGLALIIAGQFGWRICYLCMSGFMLLSILITYFSAKESTSYINPRTLKEAVIEPFKEYFHRKDAFLILAFILLYKIGEQMASDMFSPFYVDLKFTLAEIAVVTKLYGFWAIIAGGFLGGIIMLKIGMKKSLWIFGIMQSLALLGFAWLGVVGHNNLLLTLVITFENISTGMATSAFSAFMASACDTKYTATQFALLSSFMGIPRIFLGGVSGFFAKHMGYTPYFIFCLFLTLPGLLLLLKLFPRETARHSSI